MKTDYACGDLNTIAITVYGNHDCENEHFTFKRRWSVGRCLSHNFCFRLKMDQYSFHPYYFVLSRSYLDAIQKIFCTKMTHLSRGNSQSLSSGISYSETKVDCEVSLDAPDSILTTGRNGSAKSESLEPLLLPPGWYKTLECITTTRFFALTSPHPLVTLDTSKKRPYRQ